MPWPIKQAALPCCHLNHYTPQQVSNINSIASIYDQVFQVAPSLYLPYYNSLHISIQLSQIILQLIRQSATHQCSSPHSNPEPSKQAQAVRPILMSPGDNSVSRLAVFFSNQSTLLKPYNVKNMTYLSLTAVIFFSFSSFPPSPPFHQIHLPFSSPPYQTSDQWLQVSLHPAVKWPERAPGHVPQSSAEVKNRWDSTSTSLHSFKAWKGTILLTVVPLEYVQSVLHALLLFRRVVQFRVICTAGGGQTDRN